MDSAELERNKASGGTLQQAIHLRFGGTQNASETTKSQQLSGTGFKLVIPQLNIQKPATAEAISAQEAHHRAATAHNQLLLNAIKRRHEQSTGQEGEASRSASLLGQLPMLNGFSGGFSIPKLRTASGEPLEEPELDIPLLNKLRSQNNCLDVVEQVEQGVHKLKITADDGGDSAKLISLRKLELEQRQAPEPLIDLTSTLIAVQKGAPPREAASQVRRRQASIGEHFDIPFISCDTRGRLTIGPQLSTRDQAEAAATPQIVEKTSEIGGMLDATVGYPNPRRPQVKYAASPLERQHLKMVMREDYGANIKRFRFDTPSPDELVKQALQKSMRISRT